MTHFVKKSLLALSVSSLLSAASWAGTTATPKEAALNGVWKLASAPITELKDTNGKTPPLTAEGQKLYDTHKALAAKGDRSFDLSEKCKPMGFPRTLWYGKPFDMQVITDKMVFQGFTFNRNHRLFVKWSDKLPRLQIPRYYGTSSAHWDGNTLVINSGMFNENSLLDDSGLPVSDDMTFVERYIPSADGKHMEVKLTINDDKYYSKPWEVSVKFDKVANGRIEEDVCQERSAFYKPLLQGR